MGPVVPKKTEGTAHLHEAFMHQDAAKPFYGLLGKDSWEVVPKLRRMKGTSLADVTLCDMISKGW